MKEEIMGRIPFNLPIFQKARGKFDSCEYLAQFYFIGYCKRFHYTMDGPMDILHYCTGCKGNKSEPIIKFPARSQ